MLPKKWDTEPMVIVCGLISAEFGVVHMEIVEKTKDFKAFKADDLLDMLDCLRETYPDKELAIFLDNAGMHRSFTFTTKAKELGIDLIFNIPHSPKLNGIEQFWNKAKRLYRGVIGQYKVTREPFSNLDVVTKVLTSLDDEFACKCANIGWKNIENAKPVVDPEADEEEEKEPEPNIHSINSLLMQMNRMDTHLLDSNDE